MTAKRKLQIWGCVSIVGILSSGVILRYVGISMFAYVQLIFLIAFWYCVSAIDYLQKQEDDKRTTKKN